MIVSRRAYLLSQPSAQIMRAAGRSASTEAAREIAVRQVQKRIASLADVTRPN